VILWIYLIFLFHWKELISEKLSFVFFVKKMSHCRIWAFEIYLPVVFLNQYQGVQKNGTWKKWHWSFLLKEWLLSSWHWLSYHHFWCWWCSETWYMDGNCAVAPHGFCQLYVIRCPFGNTATTQVSRNLRKLTTCCYQQVFRAPSGTWSSDCGYWIWECHDACYNSCVW